MMLSLPVDVRPSGKRKQGGEEIGWLAAAPGQSQYKRKKKEKILCLLTAERVPKCVLEVVKGGKRRRFQPWALEDLEKEWERENLHLPVAAGAPSVLHNLLHTAETQSSSDVRTLKIYTHNLIALTQN